MRDTTESCVLPTDASARPANARLCSRTSLRPKSVQPSIDMSSVRVWPGRPHPLGATWEGTGVNFALYSAHATAVELCLFDSPYARPRAGAAAADRVHPPRLARLRAAPAAGTALRLPRPRPVGARRGHRFNAAKLLLDPYARAVGRRMRWHDSLFGLHLDAPERRDDRDSAAWAPLAAVDRSAPSPGATIAPPRVPWARHGDLRAARARLHQAPSRHPRGSARHLPRAGLGAGASSTSSRSASPPSSSCRCTRTSTSSTCCARA